MNATKKVLVIDDDPVVRLSFDRVLTPKGYAVITAKSGEDALERLAREDYDLVYTDIRMPGIDGIEVARRIKAEHPWLPVLIITGYGNEANEAAATAAGVTTFLHKPLAPETIEDTALAATIDSAAAWARIAIPPAKAPPAVPARGSPALAVAKNVGLFFAAPFITLAWVVIGPFALLGMLAWTGMKALKRPRSL
jgi:CheY-like chemotaxis protein